ncbi:MAG: hypothetical protein KKF48_02600 [Nanoarchaeota archaeon]|nr:hypothetical protein [Nanoarchaeota archaeon]MBU1027911.1 hypothetical protein [Nanoarchaeota archaeon]
MVKKKTKNQAKKVSDWIGTLVMFIVAVGVGGLFVDGAFLSVFLLKWLPLIVHQIVGWIIIVGGFWNLIARFM